MRRLLIAFVLLTSLVGVARAQDLPQPAPPQPEWYGWQTLASDATVAALWLTAYKTGSSGLVELGTLGYLGGTPLIHGLHGRVSQGLISLMLRLTAPLVGGVAGILVEHGQCVNPNAMDEIPGLSPCEGQGAIVGFFGAMIVVSIVDASFATTRPSVTEWRPHREAAIDWTPTVAATSAGTTFGLAGRF